MVCVGAQGRGSAMLDYIRQQAQVGVVALSDGDITPLLLAVGFIDAGDIESLDRRIRLALRRCGVGRSGAEMHRREIGDLVVDVAARRALLHGEALALTPTEFAILCALAQSPDEPVTCHQLQLNLWGSASAAGRSTLRVHVGKLRRKLGDDPASPRYLQTVRGTGYCLACDVGYRDPGVP